MEHLYTKFKKERKKWQKLFKNLYKERICWQRWTERKRQAEFLANQKTVSPLDGFLNLTDVGRRKKAKQ